MANLVYRSVKGSRLTSAEGDANTAELDRRTGRGWSDLVQDITVKAGAANAPTILVFRDNISGYAFSPDVNNECGTNFHLLHDYIDDTMVYPHVHWAVNNPTASGIVRWGIEYTWARRHDNTEIPAITYYPASQTVYIEVAIDSTHQYAHMVSEHITGQGISGIGMQPDVIIKTRWFRDAEHVNDTYPDFVFLDTVDIHYECDKNSTPNRQAPFN